MNKVFLTLLVNLSFSLFACSQVNDKNISNKTTDTTNQGDENIREEMKNLGISSSDPNVSSFYNPEYYKQFENTWVTLSPGIEYTEKVQDRKSVVGDSKISMLKIDPSKVSFEFKSATELENQKLCVADYAQKFGYNIVINSGMYNLRDGLTSAGLLINNKYYANNPRLRSGYNMMICANPKKPGLPNMQIVDLKMHSWEELKTKYNSFSQGLRMIDGEGNPMSWNKRDQICSQLIVAEDDKGLIYFIFTRSPYSQNYMISFMVKQGLKNAVYMEGGPQTSMFVDIADNRIEKVGSYVSHTFPSDTNNRYWPLPNVIGVKINNDLAN